MEVPGERCRQRLCLVVIVERDEVAPARIAAEELGRSREKHETEQQPAAEPDARELRGKKDGEETGFEEQKIPLKRKKSLADGNQRKVKDECHRKSETAREAQNDRQRHDGAGD